MAKPLVIPCFIPHQGCPHQCVFCNQRAITGRKASAGADDIDAVIKTYLAYKGDRGRVEIAFFGGNFLGLPRYRILSLLTRVQPYLEEGKIHGIRCSTRPDTVNPDILEQVSPLGLDTVELGVQSMDDQVLAAAGRGHTRADTLEAVQCLKSAGLGVGVQVMAGLPGDSREGALATARSLAALSPDMARIYPVLVLAGSRLARWYERGAYAPLTLDQAVDQAKEMLKIFNRAGVPVHRMGLQAEAAMEDGQILAGPWHPAFGHLVFSAVMLENACREIDRALEAGSPKGLSLVVHPRSLSRLQGDRKANLARLARQYPGQTFSISTERSLGPDEVRVRLRDSF